MKIIVTLITAVILAYFGWLGLNVYNMNGNLTGLNDKHSALKERVDRIADALPGIGAKVAAEELNKQFSAAVVVSQPVQKKSVCRTLRPWP
jgi:hypothetical protein